MADKTILYTHPECTICGSIKLDLDEKGIDYEEVDLAIHPEKWSDLEAVTNGERITPVMVEGGKVTIGYMGVGCSF